MSRGNGFLRANEIKPTEKVANCYDGFAFSEELFMYSKKIKLLVISVRWAWIG
jgi:hypothetical protein